jgi:hypothetical protein
LPNLLWVADIETLDQPVSHPEDVHHQSVGQEIALGVAHNLMNFDNDFPLEVGRDLDGLDMLILRVHDLLMRNTGGRCFN